MGCELKRRIKEDPRAFGLGNLKDGATINEMADYRRSRFGAGSDQELFLSHVQFEMSSVHLSGDAKQAVGHLTQVQL